MGSRTEVQKFHELIYFYMHLGLLHHVLSCFFSLEHLRIVSSSAAGAHTLLFCWYHLLILILSLFALCEYSKTSQLVHLHCVIPFSGSVKPDGGEIYPYRLHTSYPSKICRNNML